MSERVTREDCQRDVCISHGLTKPRNQTKIFEFSCFRGGMRALVSVVSAVLTLLVTNVFAHSGPPYPIFTERTVGPYIVSVWADPDTTDDGSAAGQFWVLLQAADGSALPDDTRAEVTVAPADGRGPSRSGTTEPVKRTVAGQFVALPLDREGRFTVHVAIRGSLGAIQVDTECDATYDLRPSPALVIVYVLPFVLAGGVWGTQLLYRSRARVRSESKGGS